MGDGVGLAEKLLGLEGFRVLDVVEGPDELVVTVETGGDGGGLRSVRVSGGVPGPQAGGGAGLALLRAPGAAGVGEATVALPRPRL